MISSPHRPTNHDTTAHIDFITYLDLSSSQSRQCRNIDLIRYPYCGLTTEKEEYLLSSEASSAFSLGSVVPRETEYPITLQNQSIHHQIGSIMNDLASGTTAPAVGATLGFGLPAHSTAILAFLFSLPVMLTVVYWMFVYPYFVSPLRHLPGPKLKFLEYDWIPKLFREWSKQWPETPFIRYLGLCNSETLVANNLTSYREVLSTKNSYFTKPGLSRQCANVIIGDGLPFADGHAHRHRRGVVSKPFGTSRVRSFVPTLQSKAKQLVNLLGRARGSTDVVEVESPIWKTTLDVISIEALGVDLNHLESNASPLHDLFMRTMQLPLWGHIIHFFSTYLPLRYLPLDLNKEFIDSTNGVREYLGGYVKERRRMWLAGEKKAGEPDALQCMIEQGDAMPDEDILEYLMNIMVLGHDTTACTLVLAVHTLAHNADYQTRLRDEIQTLLASDPNPSYDTVEDLPFLEKFLKEVLRVYCPLQYIPRQATSDVTVAGTFIPKGTVIQLSPGVINLNPTIWGPDAEEFNPDRWDNLEGDQLNAYAFESFHNGTRMCFGKQLALMEMKIILIELVSRFQIGALDPNAELELASPSFTLRPKERLQVRLTEIPA